MMIVKLAICLVIGSLLWLDRVYAFQFMLSRPIVMAPLLGMLMGQTQLGLVLGAALELLWLNAPPVGSFLPPDESFCAAVAVPLAAYGASMVEPATAAGLALFLALPTSLVGRRVDVFIRQRNNFISHLAQEEADLSGLIVRSLARAYAVCLVVMAATFVLLVTAAHYILPELPAALKKTLAVMPLASLIIGLGAVTVRNRRRSIEAAVFSLGLVLGFIWIQNS